MISVLLFLEGIQQEESSIESTSQTARAPIRWLCLCTSCYSQWPNFTESVEKNFEDMQLVNLDLKHVDN